MMDVSLEIRHHLVPHQQPLLGLCLDQRWLCHHSFLVTGHLRECQIALSLCPGVEVGDPVDQLRPAPLCNEHTCLPFPYKEVALAGEGMVLGLSC